MSGALAEATPGALLDEGTALLEIAGLERPRVDAEWLLAAVLGRHRFAAYLEPRRELRADEVARYRALIGRRAQREPLQHLLGYEEFCGLRLELSPDVLIPRPETEGLVEWALEVLRDWPAARVADVGTGSGAIACALACRLPALDVVALDRSRSALAVAHGNVRAHGLAGRVRLIEGDLLAPVDASAERFDVVIANLPYLESAGIESLPTEVSRWEPRLALDGGPDGLVVLRRLVMAAPHVLADGGWLLLEIGDNHAGRLAALMMGEGFSGIQSRRDLNQVERYIGGRWATDAAPARGRSC